MQIRVWTVAMVVLGVAVSGCDDGKKKRRNVVRNPVEKKFADQASYVFGVLPASRDDDLTRDYQPLVERLSKVMGQPLKLAVAWDYNSLVDDIVARRVHLAQVSAYLYVRIKAGMPAEILVQQRMDSEIEYRGVFVVHVDAPYKSIRSLNQKKFAYVDKHSSAGFFYPRMRIRELGFDPDIWFKRTTFGGSHKDVAALVRDRRVDGGVVSEQTLLDEPALRVIDRTDVIPDDAIVAGATVTGDLRNKLRSFLLTAHEDPTFHAFMTRRKIKRYVTPNADVYEPLERELGLVTTVHEGGGQ